MDYADEEEDSRPPHVVLGCIARVRITALSVLSFLTNVEQVS